MPFPNTIWPSYKGFGVRVRVTMCRDTSMVCVDYEVEHRQVFELDRIITDSFFLLPESYTFPQSIHLLLF